MVVFYSVERHSYVSTVVETPAPPSAEAAPGETIVCHCLQVTESAVVRAVRDGGARSLCELASLTGAGGGCTACHRRLRHYINERKSAFIADASNAPVNDAGSVIT
jgi:bacterioferritin-associated ferredoxin